MNHLEIEIRAWPPGDRSGHAVHALHMPTGVAVIVAVEKTRAKNQKLACERIGLLLTEAISPGMWKR